MYVRVARSHDRAVAKLEANVHWISTKSMIADMMTKALARWELFPFRDVALNI